ncbi:MAG: glycosyltransferase family 2 protein [Bacteroidetes bacterium]|nr:glycosyltransferase family 2 protein [Bacteroidota bacterium]
MDISVIIPLLNEADSLPELFTWIDRVMEEHSYTYEVIAIDDGSTDSSWNVITEIADHNPNVKGIKFKRNYGKSGALNEGFEAASGDVVITMDADLQDSPDEIPGLYKMIMEEGYHLVSGWKRKRYDPWSKTIPTKFFNATTRALTKIKLHDFNCGLKAYKNEVVKSIDVYGEMHRYIPVMAKWAGYKKIGEKVVQHQERKYGTTKFGLERFINGFLDLLSITFVTRFSKRPMHLFGLLGTLSFFIGFIILLYLSISKLFYAEFGIATRPLFYFGIMIIIIGVQLFAAGFIGELVSRNAPDRNHYQIGAKIGFE